MSKIDNEKSKRREVVFRELNKIMDKIDLENPDDKDLQALEVIMNENPEAYSMVFDLERAVQDEIIEKSFPDPIGQICIKAYVQHTRDEMGFGNAQMLERPLIDNTITCRLRLLWMEYHLSDHRALEKMRRSQLQQIEKRLSDYQRRFLRSSKETARIRKILSQTNIPQVNKIPDRGQQVNNASEVADSVKNKTWPKKEKSKPSPSSILLDEMSKKMDRDALEELKRMKADQ